MKILKKKRIAFVAVCLFLLLAVLPAHSAKAATGILPTPCENLRVGLRSSSELVATDDGYMRVYYNGNKKISIEYYDQDFQVQRKQSLDMELDIWGGFFAGSDAYYIVEGQNNEAENDSAEVIRVIKYNKNWEKQGTTKITSNPSLFGGQVRYPFDYGCVEMEEYNGMLYIVTAHEGYVDPQYGQGHQGFLIIEIQESSMYGAIVGADLWHSFAQYIAGKGSDLYILEQSEGSRRTQLVKADAQSLHGVKMSVLPYGGSRDSAWALPCYASVDGLAVSSDSILGLGTSIDQSKYDSYSSDMSYNVYLTVTPISDFSTQATKVKWLTDYSNDGKRFLGAKITKVNDNRFMVSWQEDNESQDAEDNDSLSSNILHYVFLDGKGDKVSEEFTAAAPISDCQPIVKGSDIVYYASDGGILNFYSIDAQTGKFSKKVHRVAGENAVWELKDGVLTISGTGAINVNAKEDSEESIWEPIRETVKKIVVEEGITGIPDNAFRYFYGLEEVEIKQGLKSIGKNAFYFCTDLQKITIPSSVTSMDEDALWSGHYGMDDRHIVSAEIYAPSKSYAVKYAKEHGIDYVPSDKIQISKAKISGVKKSYVYKGKAIKPKVTVKLGGKTLKKGQDYTVSYVNNKAPGTATVKIKGKNSYYGTVQKSFVISY